MIRGIVRPLDETLIAPLSGRACVAYRSRVWQGFGDASIAPPRETMQARPFVVDLGEDEVIVDSQHAIFGLDPIRLPRDRERERSFALRHGLRAAAWFSEVAIEVGARVAIGGTLVLVPRDEPPLGELGFRDPPPPSQRIVGNRARPLVVVALD